MSRNDLYIRALYAAAKDAAKPEIGTASVQFGDRTLGADMLVALQQYPKPDDAYHVTLETEPGVTQSFKVVLMPNYVFRVTFKKP